MFNGSFKGVKVRVWRVGVGHGVSYIELKRAYSKYCIAHPNICAVLGVCIQPAAVTAPQSHIRSSSISEGHLNSPSGVNARRAALLRSPGRHNIRMGCVT